MIIQRATLRLTIAFAAVQLTLFAVFAIAVYIFVTGTFDFDSATTESGLDTAERGFATLRTGLLIGYCALLVVVPVASYWMARTALVPIKRGYARQEQFVDGASHELRTPLSIMQGELELVTSRERTPGEYEASIGLSLEAIDDLSHLTNDLLLLAQTEGRYPVGAANQVALNALVFDAAGRQNVTRGPNSPTLVVSVGQNSTVMASRPLMLRVITNIVDNAAKFTRGSGTVTITTGRINGAPVVTVIDTGIGMSNDDISHAFDRFWRADNARNRPGHGIGLSLVRQIMEAHGGRVTISSALEVGTEVRLTFPRTTG